MRERVTAVAGLDGAAAVRPRGARVRAAAVGERGRRRQRRERERREDESTRHRGKGGTRRARTRGKRGRRRRAASAIGRPRHRSRRFSRARIENGREARERVSGERQWCASGSTPIFFPRTYGEETGGWYFSDGNQGNGCHYSDLCWYKSEKKKTITFGDSWQATPHMTRSCVLEKLMNDLGQEGWYGL